MEPTILQPPFLDLREITRNCAEAQLGEAATQTLLDLAQRIVATPAVCAIVSAAHHCVYETTDDYTAATQQADAVMGAEADLLHALLVLDCIRLVREKHAQRGVPSEISRAVSQRHAIAWLRDAIEQRGHVGISDWIPGWCRTVGSGELYRLGRLEFVLKAWDYPFRGYANTHTHKAIVLAEAGQQFNDDGYFGGSVTWTTTLSATDDAVIGFPISPEGYALQQQVRLPATEWHLALKHGDPVLDIHVPAEGALTIEALRDALRQAETFFDHYYPQRPFVAYVCDSWLFSPQLQAMLPPDSNILRWQREGYLLPGEDDSESFLTFTFGSKTIDIATAPQDTRLQRAVIAHLAANGKLYCGSWVLLRSDLNRFGTQPYRQAFARAITRVWA
ncbi:MAG TPA: acyltransferase domain-containing protein [Roseiflexaceae bacterium]|nr:acyltransferase domain-containing protein [Roseiflexaceae bacterium]